MQRTNTVLLTPTCEQEQQLRSLAEASARLWNLANYERRQALFKSQRVPTYAQRCKRLKDADTFKQLGTCKAQAVLMKLREAWGSYHALKRLERSGQLPPHIRRVRPPRYMKDRQTRRLVAESIYVRNDGYKQQEDVLTLSKGLRVPLHRVRAASTVTELAHKLLHIAVHALHEAGNRDYCHQCLVSPRTYAALSLMLQRRLKV